MLFIETHGAEEEDIGSFQVRELLPLFIEALFIEAFYYVRRTGRIRLKGN